MSLLPATNPTAIEFHYNEINFILRSKPSTHWCCWLIWRRRNNYDTFITHPWRWTHWRRPIARPWGWSSFVSFKTDHFELCLVRYHRVVVYILVWTQRVKPGFMHALGNTPTLNLVLRGSLDHRTVSRSVGSQNGADPGSLGLSGAPDTGPWTP